MHINAGEKALDLILLRKLQGNKNSEQNLRDFR